MYVLVGALIDVSVGLGDIISGKNVMKCGRTSSVGFGACMGNATMGQKRSVCHALTWQDCQFAVSDSEVLTGSL
jgi:hypothetical protein